MRGCIVLVWFLASAVPTLLQAQTVESGPVVIRPGGVAQLQFNTTSVDAEAIASRESALPYSTFETRRIRLQFDLEIDDWITGRIQPDFTLGRLRLADAWMNLALTDAFQLRFGQFRKPFSLIDLTSSSQIPTIERGVRIRGLESLLISESLRRGRVLQPWWGGDVVVGEEHDILATLGYTGRDIGLAAHGAVGPFDYMVGVYNGEGADSRDVNDAKSYAGRVTFRPSAALPLTLGGAISHRETRWTGTLNGFDVERRWLAGTAYGLDAEWGAFRRPGLRVLAEAVTGDDFLVGNDFFGAQGIVSFFRGLGGDRLEGVEPLFRASYGDPNRRIVGDEGWLLTPGINLYFFGRNRLMFNWDVYIARDDAIGTESAFRAQAQLAF